MANFKRPEHIVVQKALRMLRGTFFLDAACWFAGGTAIVLKHDEYRVSLDVDFLCASQAGYRALRLAAQSKGAAGLFDGAISALREFRCDQYGIRTVLSLDGQAIKFEIVREARIPLAGAFDTDLGCPLLGVDDQFAEKLLANADRCKDASVAYRDAFDLGMLVIGHGGRLPQSAIDKSVAAYGDDIWTKLRWVVCHLLQRPADLRDAASALQMRLGHAEKAIHALRDASRRADPGPPTGWDWMNRLEAGGPDDDLENGDTVADPSRGA